MEDTNLNLMKEESPEVIEDTKPPDESIRCI